MWLAWTVRQCPSFTSLGPTFFLIIKQRNDSLHVKHWSTNTEMSNGTLFVQISNANHCLCTPIQRVYSFTTLLLLPLTRTNRVRSLDTLSGVHCYIVPRLQCYRKVLVTSKTPTILRMILADWLLGSYWMIISVVPIRTCFLSPSFPA